MKYKILIADDDDNIRLTIARLFPECEVVEAANGETALSLIASERPHVFLLDMSMPGMTGLDVLAVIKNSEYKPVVFMLTGNEDIETANKALGLGARSYITKPFTPDEIRLAVSTVFEELEGVFRDQDNPWKLKE